MVYRRRHAQDLLRHTKEVPAQSLKSTRVEVYISHLRDTFMRMRPLRRLALYAVIAGTLAALVVSCDRYRFEARNRTVEITMDQQDLSDFAQAYGYNLDELMREMRRAGLTSVAVYEEQGQRVNGTQHALALTGQQIIDSARLSALGDPLLSSMVRSQRIDAASVYLLVYDASTLRRYVSVLRTQLEPSTVTVVRARLPAIVQVRTQLDFFNGLGLGIPQDIADQVRRDGLLVDPRVQNNERMGPDRIAATFDQMLQGGRVSTVIFWGPSNAVLGYPFSLDATADNFRMHKTLMFGDVESYTEDQIQKGSITPCAQDRQSNRARGGHLQGGTRQARPRRRDRSLPARRARAQYPGDLPASVPTCRAAHAARWHNRHGIRRSDQPGDAAPPARRFGTKWLPHWPRVRF